MPAVGIDNAVYVLCKAGTDDRRCRFRCCKVLLSVILYLICGIILLRYGAKSVRARYVSAAIAAVSTLIL